MAVEIRVVDLVQHYGVRPILKGVNLEVEKGELLALMGPNGMGKTTLLAAIAGVLSPQRGHVEIHGIRRRASIDSEKIIRKMVYYLPDEPWLPLQRSAREYLLAMGRVYGVDDERLMSHADQLFRLFSLESQENSPISSCSYGQRKKVAVCGALISEAPILLLDEPFSGGLDPSALLALRRVLKRLSSEESVTIVAATPVPEIIDEIADRIAIIADGKLLAIGNAAELRAKVHSEGSLEEVLEKLIRPKTFDQLDEYFSSRDK